MGAAPERKPILSNFHLFVAQQPQNYQSLSTTMDGVKEAVLLGVPSTTSSLFFVCPSRIREYKCHGEAQQHIHV
jgi:hypothetical protein